MTVGRIILFLLIIAALVLIWKAFGPSTWQRNQGQRGLSEPIIKGPDDDENFLWELEKKQFKQRRAKEEAQRQEEERIRRAQEKYNDGPQPDEPES